MIRTIITLLSELKIWLDPIRLQKSGGFTRNEITEIIKIVEKNKNKLTEKWNEFFSNRS